MQQNEEFERNIDELSEVVTVPPKSTQKVTAPSITKILRYTIPAIGIWLCSPVLSMIDTAAVGLLSGTAQQAALNPAVSVTDYGALVVAFMYTATTNLIAASVQEDKDDFQQDTTANMNKGLVQPKTTTTLITALKLALFVGTTFGAVIYTCGQHLLKLLIGNDSLDPTVFSSALRYVQIRSLGVPAMVVIGTAQSACLGMQDVTSPLYVLLAASVINFLGDVCLVPMSSTLFGGAAGAAWATVASQYAALIFFARWLTTAPASRNDTDTGSVLDDGSGGKRQKMLESLLFWRNYNKDELQANVFNDEVHNGNGNNVVNVTQGIMELFRKFLTSTKLARRVRRVASVSSGAGRFIEEAPIITDTMTVDTTTKSMEPPTKKEKKQKKKRSPKTRGFLSNSNLSLRSYVSLSNLNKVKAAQFLPFVIPVTTTSVGRISGYIAMSHVASSTLGTFDMAGHQIIFSIFCCLTPFVDALSQVAQSFVPAVYEAKERSTERALALRKTINNFRKVGVGFGLTLVTLVSCIPLISRYFTTDPLVLERVNGAIPGVGLFMLVNGLMCAGEGTLLGQKDLKFLRNMYAIFFFAVPGYMLRLKHRSLSGLQNVGIGTMWAAFSTYNVIRTIIWHLRLAQLQRRTQRGIDVVDGEDT